MGEGTDSLVGYSVRVLFWLLGLLRMLRLCR